MLLRIHQADCRQLRHAQAPGRTVMADQAPPYSHALHTHFGILANLVERFLRDISTQQLRRVVFTRVPELTEAMYGHIVHHIANPKPFIWPKPARDILQKVIRAAAS